MCTQDTAPQVNTWTVSDMIHFAQRAVTARGMSGASRHHFLESESYDLKFDQIPSMKIETDPAGPADQGSGLC